MRLLAALALLSALPALASAIPPTAPAASTPPLEFDHSHKLFDEVLKKSVVGQWLDYKKVDRTQLRAYIGTLEAVTPGVLASWTKAQRYAFWINVYNAHVIEIVLEHYPVESIKDIGGALFGKVFDKEFIKLNVLHPDGDDDRLSLNDVENEILRPRFQDARVHAAINCASYSCPPLLGAAFVADKLDAQLDAQMKAFVVDALRNRYDEKENVLYLSKIFEWFEGDFERDAGSVKRFLLKYAPKERQAFIEKAKIKHLDYDWSLNDVAANRG